MLVDNFESLNISQDILQAINDMGFTQPTQIQAETIPLLLQGRDVIGQSQTGTGKTASFGIPAIETLDENKKAPQVLILCPTRELAMQVSNELEKLTRYKKKVNSIAIYGGASITNQIKDLKRGPQIVVGTPGRIMDHLDRGTLHLEEVSMVVLDEADEMLDMGFRDDIEAILEEVPMDRQTVFFSATMAKPIMDLTARYQQDPAIVKVQKKQLTVEAIEQIYIETREDHKAEVLERLIDMYEPRLCLVFCNTKKKVDELVGTLQKAGFFAEALHGDMRQAMRTQVMNKFKQGIIQILVATDVAARGIDVEDMELVVNYDLPMDSEDYVHRIGRTGRAGRKGMAISLLTKRDYPRLRDIEKYTKGSLKQEKVPSLRDIESKKRKAFLNKIKTTIEEGELEKYLGWVSQLESEGITGAEIAAALIKMEVHQQIAQEDKLIYAPSGDRDRGDQKDGKKGQREKREQPKGKAHKKNMARLFITLGKKNHISPKDIVGAIASEAGMEGRLIGEIDIYDKFSFVEIPTEYADNVIKKMRKTLLKGQKFNIDAAVPKK
jgi:ATP-dependent RNA helicase DeaD